MHNLYSSMKNTSFKPSLKAVDPKVLRRVDAAAARNTVAASLASLIVFAVVAFSSGLYQAMESLVMSYGVAMLFVARSEEHTSELQSRPHLVCRLLLEKK